MTSAINARLSFVACWVPDLLDRPPSGSSKIKVQELVATYPLDLDVFAREAKCHFNDVVSGWWGSQYV